MWVANQPEADQSMTSERWRRGCGDAATYGSLREVALRLAVEHPDPSDRLQPLTDALWETLHPCGLSWIGFYLEDLEHAVASAGDNGLMILAARRDKPACSPIGLHGACGQSFREEAVRLIEDVALLGPNYIACDPRDRSELVVPIYRNEKCWGVLDADSHELACFGDSDIEGLCGVLRAAGLLGRAPAIRADRLRRTEESL
jgi:putative methionine-R-sulfoxide reductase with GAF domain